MPEGLVDLALDFVVDAVEQSAGGRRLPRWTASRRRGLGLTCLGGAAEGRFRAPARPVPPGTGRRCFLLGRESLHFTGGFIIIETLCV